MYVDARTHLESIVGRSVQTSRGTFTVVDVSDEAAVVRVTRTRGEEPVNDDQTVRLDRVQRGIDHLRRVGKARADDESVTPRVVFDLLALLPGVVWISEGPTIVLPGELREASSRPGTPAPRAAGTPPDEQAAGPEDGSTGKSAPRAAKKPPRGAKKPPRAAKKPARSAKKPARSAKKPARSAKPASTPRATAMAPPRRSAGTIEDAVPSMVPPPTVPIRSVEAKAVLPIRSHSRRIYGTVLATLLMLERSARTFRIRLRIPLARLRMLLDHSRRHLTHTSRSLHARATLLLAQARRALFRTGSPLAARGPWPSVLLASCAAVAVTTWGWSSSPARPAITAWFMLVCPGMALVRLLPYRGFLTRIVLAVAASLAIETCLAEIALETHAWSPGVTLGELIAITVAGVVLELRAVGSVFEPRAERVLRE